MNQALGTAKVALAAAESSIFDYAGHAVRMLLPSKEDHISRMILNGHTFYEDDLLQALGRELESGDLVLDVGANIGNHTVFFAMICDCKVVSFEPNPEAFHFLGKNVELNKLGDRVELHQVAVGRGKGKASITSTLPNNLGATRFSMDEGGDYEVVRLDDMDFSGRVALLKIDVEGMDLEVLRGAVATIRKHRPLVVCEAQTAEEFKEIFGALEEFGYAAAGCFNATETYLFMPAKTQKEQLRLARHEAMEIVRTQLTLREAKAQLQKQKQIIDKQAFMLRQLSTRVNGEEDGARGIVGELDSLASMADQLNRRIDSLAPRIDEMRTIESKFDRLDGQIGLLSPQFEQVRQLSAQVGKLEGRLEMLVPQLDQFQQLASKHEKLDGRLEAVNSQLGQVAPLSTKIDQLQSQLKALEPSIASTLGELEGQIAALAPRVEQAFGDLTSLANRTNNDLVQVSDSLADLQALVEEVRVSQSNGLDTHSVEIEQIRALQAALSEQIPSLRSVLAEVGQRINHVAEQGSKADASLGAQIKRLDQRISEQVRLGKEAAADTRERLASIDRIDADLQLLCRRHEALLNGRIFRFLRMTKSVVRFVAWPLLKVIGRAPASVPAAAAAPQQPVPPTAARTAAPLPRPTKAAPTPITAATPEQQSLRRPVPAQGREAPLQAAVAQPAAPQAVVQRAAELADTEDEAAPPLVLTNVPYMRRPLKGLKTSFLQLPIAENALVSVVMTTYNSAAYLREAIGSILAQIHKNLELLVVDDCSSDNTREIVREMAGQDARIKLFSFGENRGTYWCKNIGITHARGAAITFMDSDDISEPTRIARQLEQLRIAGTAVSTCLHERRDSAGNLVSVNGRTKRLAYISQMMRRQVFDVIGYFDSVRTSADDEMLRRIKRVFGNAAHQCVQEVLYKALVHGASLTQDPANRGVSTVPGGLSVPRKAYSDAVDVWHADLARKGAYPFVPFPVVRRPFAIHRRLSVTGGADQNDMISVCLASFPPRRSALKAAVASLIDQVDRVYVYLNQYEEVPAFLKHPRITVKIGGEDLRDNGKFYFGAEVPEGYCFTVDDDIIYPPDYVQGLIRKIEFYGRKAMVGLHGTIFAKPLESYFAGRTLFHFKHPLERDRIVNQLGTGTLAFHTSLWRPTNESFETTGMMDAWIAVEAAKRKIPLIAVERGRNWLRPMEMGADVPPPLFNEFLNRDTPQTELVKSVEPWLEQPGPALSAVIAARMAAGGEAYTNGIAEIAPQSPAGAHLLVTEPDQGGRDGPVILHRSDTMPVRPAVRGCVLLVASAAPGRLEAFIESIAKQLDELFIILPKGSRVPEFLSRYPNVHACASNFGDARVQFDALVEFRGYYVPLDISIDYPKHYIRQLIDAIDRYDRKAVVGWHGQPVRGAPEVQSGGDRQVRSLSLGLCAFHTDTLKIKREDFAGETDVDRAFSKLGRVQGVPFVEIGDVPPGTKSSLQASLSGRATIALDAEAHDAIVPVLPTPYQRPAFKLAVVGRTDRARWKKGGILKSTHLTAEMLHPYGIDVALVDLETGDPRGLDGHQADIVMIYPGDPERPDFVNVLDLVDHHARKGRAVLVNLSLNGRSSRKRFICEQMLSWRAQYGKRVAMMVFSDRVFDDPELAPVVDSIVAIPKTLQVESARHVDFHATSGIFLGDYGKLCDESLLAWPAEKAIAVLREAVPQAHLFAVQQYRPKVRKDLDIEILPFLTYDFSEVLASSRLMVSLVKFATFEMVPIEVAALGVPLLHAKMENSISDYMGLGAIEVTSLERLGTFAQMLYNDPLCWSGLSRAGHAITHGLDYRNMSAQMYLRLLEFLRESGATGAS